MLLNLFDARQAKKLARSLEKEFAARGVQMAHGQALDMLARLAGQADWKEVLRSRSPEVLDRQLMSVELEHIRENAGNDYGEEAVLLVHNGFQLRYSVNDEEPCDYVRVCDPLGREIAYWVSDEWRDDPQMVMGAILGALAQGAPLAPAKDGLRGAATTHEHSAAARPSEPRIQDVRFEDLSAIVIDGNHWSVYFVESEMLGRLRDDASAPHHNATGGEDDEELFDEDEVLVHLADDSDPPHVTERDLTVQFVRSLRWDAASGCFVDEDGTTYDFIYAQRFADTWQQRG